MFQLLIIERSSRAQKENDSIVNAEIQLIIINER